jgi:hypothetical protein
MKRLTTLTLLAASLFALPLPVGNHSSVVIAG